MRQEAVFRRIVGDLSLADASLHSREDLSSRTGKGAPATAGASAAQRETDARRAAGSWAREKGRGIDDPQPAMIEGQSITSIERRHPGEGAKCEDT